MKSARKVECGKVIVKLEGLAHSPCKYPVGKEGLEEPVGSTKQITAFISRMILSQQKASLYEAGNAIRCQSVLLYCLLKD